MNLNRCKRCRRPILWASTTRGTPVPLDVEPHVDGNVELTEFGAMFLTERQAATQRMLGSSNRYRPHSASCPRTKARISRPKT